MTIQTQLRFIIILPIVLGFIVAGIIGWMSHETSTAVRENRAAGGIAKDILDLASLSRDISMHSEEGRARDQWRKIYQILDSKLKGTRFESERAQRYLDRLVQAQQDVLELFAKLTYAADTADTGPQDFKVVKAHQQRMLGQMMVSVQRMATNAWRLGDLSREHMIRTYQKGNLAILSVAATAALLLVGFGIVLGRHIASSVATLRKGAQIFACGHLEHCIGLTASNEFGELSQTMDNMAINLKRVTASRDALERETARRAEAEAEIRKINDQLEQRIRARTLALETSNKELEQFAYVASHDLQEPLRMVASYTELLAERYRGKLDEKADMYIGYAVDGARRMQGLITDLLAISRVGTRGKPFEETDCNALVSEVIQGLGKAIEESGSEIVADGLPTVLADRTQLSQVFQNLIENAIKFRKDAPPRVKIMAQRNRAEWEFCIEDNGIGIDPKFHERILVIFQRLHERGKYPGTGIGLAIVKKIVERHGGRLWVDSEPGTGSRFCFTIAITDNALKE